MRTASLSSKECFAPTTNPICASLRMNARVIFNWSPCSGGTHWLAFLKHGNTGWWFDSYGLEPGSNVEKRVLGGDPGFRKWIESQVRDWHYNTVDMQGLYSDVCGQYSCWAVKNGLPKQNTRAWNWVSTDQNRNDSIIQQLVRIPGFKTPLR